MKEIVVNNLYRIDYFQWFILGFYELKNNNSINFKFKTNLLLKLLSKTDNRYVCSITNRIRRKVFNDSYLLKGYYIDSNNNKKKFVIDSADSPYIFDLDELKDCDIYFKIQCPKNLDDDVFYLNKELAVPWSDHKHVDSTLDSKVASLGERKIIENFHEYSYKIKPLMLGPRSLGRGLSYKELNDSYKNFVNNVNLNKEKNVMCYFGNAEGPKLNTDNKAVDFDNESNMCGIYKDILNHPNCKRAKISDIINKVDSVKNDGRVISKGNADSGSVSNSLVVPLKDFPAFVSKFKYNFNVSGYRLSIPSRFIDSFSVGTSIITDELSVKWYLPFSKDEVIETVPMGYLKDEDVDYNSIISLLQNLPDQNPKNVIDNYNKKWSPVAVAQYIIETLENCDK